MPYAFSALLASSLKFSTRISTLIFPPLSELELLSVERS
jgi:hypothetical protein